MYNIILTVQRSRSSQWGFYLGYPFPNKFKRKCSKLWKKLYCR